MKLNKTKPEKILTESNKSTTGIYSFFLFILFDFVSLYLNTY